MGTPRFQIRTAPGGDGYLIVGRNAGGWQVRIPAHDRATAERMVAKLKAGKDVKVADFDLPARRGATTQPDLDWDIAPGGLQASAFPEFRTATPRKPGTQLGLFRCRRGRGGGHAAAPHRHSHGSR